MTIKIRSANNSIKIRDKKHLSHDLKRVELERVDNVKIANGDISTKTLINIYLIEYIKIKLRKPIDTMVFIIPSIENTFALFPSTLIIASEMLTNLEKQISACKKFPPYISNCSRNKRRNIDNLLTKEKASIHKYSN